MKESMNTKINAISHEFPFIASYSNKRPEHRPASPCCVKQFNEQRFGNNREAPNYLQLPSLKDNHHTYLNTYIEKSIEVEKGIKNHQKLSKVEEISNDTLKRLSSYVHKQGFNTSKSLEKGSLREKVYMEKLNISPKYLKNLNDFNISESFKINEDRQIKFEKKSSKRFNCLTDQVTEIKPGILNVDKWSKFYENYLTISERDSGFKYQKGYFTDFADHQKIQMDLNKYMNINHQKKDKKELEETSKKINKRYVSLNKESFEKRKQKTLEVVDKNKLYKLKSYLVKNGVLD